MSLFHVLKAWHRVLRSTSASGSKRRLLFLFSLHLQLMIMLSKGTIVVGLSKCSSELAHGQFVSSQD
jgi:hypothetical protein